MAFDGDRVRIELCDAMTVSFGNDPQLGARQCAEVRLSDDAGNILRTRKPAARLIGESRAGLLRALADWMEQKDDPGLTGFVAEYEAQRNAPDA